VTGLILGGFAGPGGWAEGARMLGLTEVGIELDEAACLTRAAAGHKTIRANMVSFPVEQLAGKVTGIAQSPPCTMFSSAGTGAGNAILGELSELIRDMFAGRKTRAAHRNAMARALHAADWPPPRMRPTRFGRTLTAKQKHKTPVRLTVAQRSAAIRKAVFSASLVAEPARFIHACRPEWIALEQVPSVLPLWKAYAAELRAMGYSVWTGILNSASYGVPQTRERAILIASRVRRVAAPPPTHYEKCTSGDLFGDGKPWVSMAAALGWGATGRAAPTVTAGGTAAGGAEPFGHRDRDALLAAQEAGQWALRSGNQDNAAVRDVTAPAPAMSFGHASADCQWVLRMDDQAKATLPRPADEPAPTIQFAHRSNLARWELHTNRDQRPDGSRQTVDPSTAPAPAPALTAKSGGQWQVRTSFGVPSDAPRNGTHEMDPAEQPAHTVTGKAKDWAAWVTERPATTVQGDPRVGRPGHKDRDQGESMFEQDSVRITVQEAAILQSFPPDYPWQGTRTAQFRQVGDAVPPRLAMHVLAEATGLPVAALEAGAA
jgi:DNA (cytosine-5)-methyltransferase 1